MLDIKECKDKDGDYLQISLHHPRPQRNSQHQIFSVDEFFVMHEFPCIFDYSEYFKVRFHNLSVEGLIRPEGLSSDFKRSFLKQNRRMVQKRGPVNCLKGHGQKIMHEHVDGLIEGWLHNFNNSLKKERCTDKDRVVALIDEMHAAKDQYTGHWLIYCVVNERKLYLDICRHGDDSYLKDVAIWIYKKEFPTLFS